MSLLNIFEITNVLQKFPSQMSQGQKQRVAAARCLIANPDIILADEPTGSLDTCSARTLMEKLKGMNQKDERTVLMVTYDANAASFCSRILFRIMEEDMEFIITLLCKQVSLSTQQLPIQHSLVGRNLE